MVQVTSARERRLWTAATAIVVAIFATLGFAGGLVDELRRRELFDALFVTGFLMSLAAIVATAVRRRPRGPELVMILGVAAAYLMVLSRLGIPERTHLFEYTIVAILVHEALLERSARGRTVRWPAATAAIITSAVGIVDESIQLLLPTRVFDVIDMAFNVLAAVGGVAAKTVIERLARRDPGQELAPGQPDDGTNRWA